MKGLERVAGVVSFAAGIIHAAAGPEHYAEWWAYGLFFYGAAALQMSYGVIVGTQGIEAWGGWQAIRSKVYLVGITGNVLIILLWLLTRLVAIPAGPEAGEREAVGIIDAVSKTVESILIVILARLFVLAHRRPMLPAPVR